MFPAERNVLVFNLLPVAVLTGNEDKTEETDLQLKETIINVSAE